MSEARKVEEGTVLIYRYKMALRGSGNYGAWKWVYAAKSNVLQEWPGGRWLPWQTDADADTVRRLAKKHAEANGLVVNDTTRRKR